MKNLFKTLSFIGLSLSLGMSAQTSSSKAKAQIGSQPVPQNAAKAAFVNNQSYLQPSSVVAYNTYYGDSLKGFEEAKITKDVLAKGLPGWEAQIHIHNLKRAFINAKYGIGRQETFMPIPKGTPAPKAGGKTIGGTSTVNGPPCVNEDFESTPPGQYTTMNAVLGWTITSRNSDSNCSPVNWNQGSPEFWIVQTPILNWGTVGGIMGVIPQSPLGGNHVAQLNDMNNNVMITRIQQQFPVTTQNSVFQFAYAGYWQDGGSGHQCCPVSADQPGINMKMYDCVGAPLACSALSLSPGPGCQSQGVTYTVTGGASWTNWQVKYVDLTPYIGSCVTIEITTADCAFGGHWGSTLFDARCGGQLVGGLGIPGNGGNIGGPVSFCAGSNLAQISAPIGYSSYQWFHPVTGIIPAPTGTNQNLQVPGANTLTGMVFTVQMIAPSGCMFTATNQINTSTVSIVGIGASSTCPGGASGSATVVGNGSGTGYNYTWLNAGNGATVGTTQSVNGLAPGVYNVIITGFGSAGCGSAIATTTVYTGPPGITPFLKPFCGSEAYLGVVGGSNFKWYNGGSAIPAPFGNQPTYTVTSPVANSVYWLSYLSPFGCRDSLQYTLIQSAPGAMGTSYVSRVCPGGVNGIAQVTLIPAPSAPGGMNSFLVTSMAPTPPFTASLFPTSSNSFNLTGLAGGTYSVSVFDGSCKYNTTFNVVPFTFNYSLTPTSATLCPGKSVAAAISFSNPTMYGQYTYSWTPTNQLFGATASNAIITPTLPNAPMVTTVYSVIVTPTLINCPIVKTISVTAVNPPTPTITAIPNLCNTFAPYQIITNPPGGVFSTGVSGTNNPISSPQGIITPSLVLNTPSLNSVYSLTYAITVYTCGASNTATYQVSKFWSSALTTPTITPLCVTSPPFNLMNVAQNTQNGAWSVVAPTPPGAVISGTQFNPSGLNTSNYVVSYNTVSTPNATVCPSSTTLNVSVTKTITPVITPVAEFCTNAPSVTITATPAGGGWMPNTNSAISNQGVINPTLVPVPSMVGTYTVMVGPCLNSNTTAISVSKFYPAGFTGLVPNLCAKSSGGSAPVNLMGIVQSTVNGSWNTFVTNTSNGQQYGGVLSNSFFPTGLATGTYIATYNTVSFPNPLLCPDSRTIAISVLNPVIPTITPVSTMCNNAAAVQLTVSPANAGQWTGTPYLASNGVFTPSLTSVGNNFVEYVVGTNTCNVKDSKTIKIEAFVPATIVSKMPDLCNTSPVMNLSPFTVSGLGVWSGPGITGTSFNPANTGSGQFILTHNTASSPSGLCPDEATISVNVYSLAVPVLTPVDAICNTAMPFKIQVSPVGGLFGGPDANIVSVGGQFNPGAAIIGNNVVNYSITSGPCVAYAQTVIKVEKFISAELAKYPGPFCKTEEPVNLDSYVLNTGGKWFQAADETGKVGPNMFHPKLAMFLPAKNNLTYRTSSIPSGLCPDERTIQIEVREPIAVTVDAQYITNCAPVEVKFSTPSTNNNKGTGTWILEDGSEPKTGLSDVVHIYTTPGSYKAQFNYVDEYGCKSEPVRSVEILVNEVPKADFSVPDEIYISDAAVQLTNLSTDLNDNKYEWKVSGINKSFPEINPIVTFPKIGKYNITLVATSSKNCADETTKMIEVKNIFNVFIPNSFTPNFDGLNDYFMPTFSKEGLDTRSFEMEIFDRWGHSIYHTKDSSTKGWDGSVQNKGEPLKSEVYVYKIKYKDMDGNSYNKMGHVSLVK